MSKNICPYCGETENFIVLTDETEEFRITYDKRVRCGNCYKLFTDELYREFEVNNKLGIKDTDNLSLKRRRTLYPPYFNPFEVAQARRARSISHESASWRYEESAKRYPNNWEAVFFAEYYKVVARSAAENMTLYQSFVNVLYRSLHLASSALSGEELRIAIEEIFDETMNLVYVFYANFEEAVERCLSGEYPGLCRVLMSVDVSAIFEIMRWFTVGDIDTYRNIIYSLREHSDILDAFGLMKLKFITTMQQQYGNSCYHYPTELFNSNDSILSVLKHKP